MATPPKNPDFFDKVNYVIDAWSCGCEAPWYIYVETMGPAALKAFITFSTFGWDDVLRGYWRPRGMGRGRHGRRRRPKHGRFRLHWPEWGEEIGKKLPGAEEVKGRHWGELGKNLWRIDSHAQLALFWWMVADIVNDFAFDWTSQLYEQHWCPENLDGMMAAHSDDFEGVNAGFFPMHFLTVSYNRPPVVWVPPIHGFTGNLPCTVIAAGAVGFAPNGTTGYQARIRYDDGSGWREAAKSTSAVNRFGVHESITKAKVPPFSKFEWECRTDGPIFWMGERTITASECGS